ncbi:hypothetical protein AB4089_21440 [Arthrobacter sp. 2MCAF15]|uniref:hypothetical protein n=1 Tax=Arthrobacter sp. 2MCAF15 TaxID=3232984 RepID=UPI003F93CE26
MALGNKRRRPWAAVLALGLLTACAPFSPAGGPFARSMPASPGPAAGIEASRDAAAPDGGSPPSAPAKAARLFSQAEVESLAGVVAGPGGVTGEVLTGGPLWDENQSLHFGAGSAQVSPAKCSGVLAWAMLMSGELPAAGTFSGTDAEPVFVAVTADRDAVLALAFSSVRKLPDCSPARLTMENGTFTATYQRASAFTEADQSYAVIATIFLKGRPPAHFLRVAAKNGTLFVQATMPLADPANYRTEADFLTLYINQVVRGEQQLLDGASPSPGPGPEPWQEPPGDIESS